MLQKYTFFSLCYKSTHFFRSFGFVGTVVLTLAGNGKSIGEVREFEEPKVQEFRNEANAFSDCLN